MKRKIFLIIAIIIILGIIIGVLILINSKKNKNNENNNTINYIEIAERPMREIEETEELKSLPQSLQDIGVETTKNTELKFEKMGAICGYVLQAKENKTASIAILQYDKKSEEYKKVEKEQKVTLKDENGNEISSFNAKVSNGFAFKVTGNFPKYEEVVELLKKLKTK